MYSGTVVYGNITTPTDFGSGGSASAGGGAIKIKASGILRVDGTISSTGVVSCGSGAGGSVWLEADILSGYGSISANGYD